jgi:glutamate-1-semialdehyde aminotransferase
LRGCWKRFKAKVESIRSAKLWERSRLATHHGALLIADETSAAWDAFATCVPEVSLEARYCSVAKPLAAGLPLGAIITNAAVASPIKPDCTVQHLAAAR